VRDEDEEDDEDGDNELATDDGTRGAGLGELDPLSDDDEEEDGQGS